MLFYYLLRASRYIHWKPYLCEHIYPLVLDFLGLQVGKRIVPRDDALTASVTRLVVRTLFRAVLSTNPFSVFQVTSH